MKEKREGGRETRDRTGQERPFKNVINQLLRPLPFFSTVKVGAVEAMLQFHFRMNEIFSPFFSPL